MSQSWRKAWLAQSNEPVIEPDRPILDAHIHFWHELNGFADSYLAGDFAEDVRGSGHNVMGAVYVECGANQDPTGPADLRPVGETAFALEQASALGTLGGPPVAAVTAYVDLLRGEAIAPALEAHRAAGQGRLRAVRQRPVYTPGEGAASPEADGARYADLGFRAGVKLLGRMGLALETLIFSARLADLAALARDCPETVIIANHYGAPLGIGGQGPGQDEIFARWSQDLVELAGCANMHIKLGGLAMPMMGYAWHERDAPPSSELLATAQSAFFDHALSCFGPARALFESNYPVEKCSASYRVVWNTFKRLAAPLTDGEKDALFQGTAMRVYGIV